MRLVQLVEHQIVVLGVVGSSPTSHPKESRLPRPAFSLGCYALLRYPTPKPPPSGRWLSRFAPWRRSPLLTAQVFSPDGAGLPIGWCRSSGQAVQVPRPSGAGPPAKRCRSSGQAVQVSFFVGDLRHQRLQKHDSRRGTPLLFRTCTGMPRVLRPTTGGPAPQ